MARRAAAPLHLLLLLAGAVGAAWPAAGQQQPYPYQARPPVTVDPARAALEARILRLEEEVRRLTGRVEELEYANSRLTGRLDKLVGDVDERLSAVEAPPRGGSARADASGADAGPPPPPAPAEPPLPRGTSRPSIPPPPIPPLPPPGDTARAPAVAAPAATAPDVQPDAAAARGYVLGAIPRDAAGAAAQGPRTPPEELGYDGALGLLQGGRWADAEQAFKAFLERSPNDPRAASAAYWLGETYFFRKDYQGAAAAFARNYKTYGPDATKAPDNLLKLGMSLAALGDKGKACQAFGELAKRHPNAPAPVKQTLARERANASCPTA